jgi:hypothetical protein
MRYPVVISEGRRLLAFGPPAALLLASSKRSSRPIRTSAIRAGIFVPNSISCAALSCGRDPGSHCPRESAKRVATRSILQFRGISWLGATEATLPPFSAMSLAVVPTCPATSRTDLAASSLARDISFATVCLRSLKSLCSALRASLPASVLHPSRPITASLSQAYQACGRVPHAIGGATAF